MYKKVIKKLEAEVKRAANWFIFIGVAIIAVAIIARAYFMSPVNVSLDDIIKIIVTVGISVFVVGVIARIWDRLGGDPLTNAFKWIFQKHYLEKIGLEHYIIRNSDDPETLKFYSDLHDEIKTAKSHVDMMSLILHRNFFKGKNFAKIFKKSLKPDGPKFRILILKPFSNNDDSVILRQRAIDESLFLEGDDIKKDPEDEADRMNRQIKKTLKKIACIWKDQDDETKKKVEVRVVDRTYLTCSIINIDDKKIVSTHYWHNTGGGGTPTFEIKGPHSPLFEMYSKEFDRVWENSSVRDLNEDLP
jgi:organic radical activating enzyme